MSTTAAKTLDKQGFRTIVKKAYEDSLPLTDGHPADYIPELAAKDPTIMACAASGLRGTFAEGEVAFGDVDYDFTVQSVGKVVNYIAARMWAMDGEMTEEESRDYVHRYVGFEPSGLAFNAASMTRDDKAPNPFVNEGAIAIVGVLLSERLDGARMTTTEVMRYVIEIYERLTQAPVGFCILTYNSEKAVAWQNKSLVYYLKANGLLPEGVDPEEALDLYLQLCSIKVKVTPMAHLAGVLANYGRHPLTDHSVVPRLIVRDTKSLMLTCGMYDAAGSTMVLVGNPGKTGVAGLVITVSDEVYGLAAVSPPLDDKGNSVRGMFFVKAVSAATGGHVLAEGRKTKALDGEGGESKSEVPERILALTYIDNAATKDLEAMKAAEAAHPHIPFHLRADYDKRTALHLAFDKGHRGVALYLVAKGADPYAKDKDFTSCIHEARKAGMLDVFTEAGVEITDGVSVMTED